MAYALEDEYTPAPKRSVVEAQISDWKTRLADLYTLIESWAAQDPCARAHRANMTFHEPMLKAAGLPPVKLPALGLLWDTPAGVKSRPDILFRPEARWVSGTRGRVWTSVQGTILYLIDKGDDDAADWWIYPRRSPTKSVPFTKEEFNRIVDELL